MSMLATIVGPARSPVQLAGMIVVTGEIVDTRQHGGRGPVVSRTPDFGYDRRARSGGERTPIARGKLLWKRTTPVARSAYEDGQC
jgi:hypothetical protein